MDDEFLKTVKIVNPADNAMMLIDRDILGCFKRQGEGYQEKINLLLRKYMETQQLKKS